MLNLVNKNHPNPNPNPNPNPMMTRPCVRGQHESVLSRRSSLTLAYYLL